MIKKRKSTKEYRSSHYGNCLSVIDHWDLDQYTTNSLTITKWKISGFRLKFFKKQFSKMRISRGTEFRTISESGKNVKNFLEQVMSKEWTIMPRTRKGAARYLNKRLEQNNIHNWIIYY